MRNIRTTRPTYFSTMPELYAALAAKAGQRTFQVRYERFPRLIVFKRDARTVNWGLTITAHKRITIGNLHSMPLANALKRAAELAEKFPLLAGTPERHADKNDEAPAPGEQAPQNNDAPQAAVQYVGPSLDEICEALKDVNGSYFPALRQYIDAKFEEQSTALMLKVEQTLRALVG